MPRRREPQQRASERLNIALARVQASIGLLDIENMSVVPLLKKQMDEAIEEAFAALADIRQAAGSI
jgi:hypothetical protein